MNLNWSEVIKEACLHQGFKPKNLAEDSGISGGYLNQLIKGKRKAPSVEIALTILSYHPDAWLLHGGILYRYSGKKWLECNISEDVSV